MQCGTTVPPTPDTAGQTWLSPAHRETRPTYSMNCHHFMPHVAIRVRECPGACGNGLFVRHHLALCQHLLRVKPWLWQGRAEYCWPSLRSMLWALPGIWVVSEAFLTSECPSGRPESEGAQGLLSSLGFALQRAFQKGKDGSISPGSERSFVLILTGSRPGTTPTTGTSSHATVSPSYT